MTTIYHTPIPTNPKQLASAATINAPLSQLDAQLVAQDARVDAAEGSLTSLDTRVDEAEADILALVALQSPMLSGRLTLQSGKPVPDAAVSDAAVIYFAPYHGNISVVNGQGVAFAEKSLDISDVLSGEAHDVYLCKQNVEGVITYYIGYGPAWAGVNDRGSGINTAEITLQNGIYVNKYSMHLTCGPSAINVDVNANEATLLGSFLATAAGQTCDDATRGYLFNVYNQVDRMNWIYTENEHDYTAGVLRNWGGTDETKLQVFFGLPGQKMSAHLIAYSGGHAYIGLDFYASADLALLPGYSSGSDLFQTVSMDAVARLGKEFVVATEEGSGAATGYFGSAGVRLFSLR